MTKTNLIGRTVREHFYGFTAKLPLSFDAIQPGQKYFTADGIELVAVVFPLRSELSDGTRTALVFVNTLTHEVHQFKQDGYFVRVVHKFNFKSEWFINREIGVPTQPVVLPLAIIRKGRRCVVKVKGNRLQLRDHRRHLIREVYAAQVNVIDGRLDEGAAMAFQIMDATVCK